MTKSIDEIIRTKDMTRSDIVVESFRPLIISSIRKYFNKPYLYEELYQEGVICVCESILKYDENRKIPFKAYLKTNMYHLYIGMNKDRNYRENLSLDYETEEGTPIVELISSDMDVEKLYEDRELYKKLLMALRKISDMERIIICEFYINGQAIVDIANQLDIPYRTCYNAKTRGLKKIIK